jgi:hypothetical protein
MRASAARLIETARHRRRWLLMSIAQGLKMKDGLECNSCRDMSASGDITIPQFVTGPLLF